MELNEVYAIFRKIKGTMEELQDRYGDFPDYFEHDTTNAEEKYEFDNARFILMKLEDAYARMEWMEKPIKAEGKLVKNKYDRYEIEGTDYYFTTGYPLDVWFYDDWKEEYRWKRSVVEHNEEDYYIKALGKETPIEGVKVRTR